VRKAIRLRATLWVEGEQEPAADFAAFTTKRVRALLERAAQEEKELRVSVRAVKEDEGEDEEEEEEDAGNSAR
jgi:hypothetical protein